MNPEIFCINNESHKFTVNTKYDDPLGLEVNPLIDEIEQYMICKNCKKEFIFITNRYYNE